MVALVLTVWGLLEIWNENSNDLKKSSSKLMNKNEIKRNEM